MSILDVTELRRTKNSLSSKFYVYFVTIKMLKTKMKDYIKKKQDVR